MIDLSLTFKRPVDLTFFILVTAIASCWTFIRLKKRLKPDFFPLIALNSALFLFWTVTGRIYHDEGVHLHLSWLISQGLVPYRDFWFHHSPLFWAIISPLVSLLEKTNFVFESVRFLALLVLAANAFLGWKIAKKVWQKNASLPVYLLVLSSIAIKAQLELFRPDIFMIFLLLAGIYFLLDSFKEKAWPCFLTGLFFGLAASFLVKQYLIYLLPFIAVFFWKEKRFLKLFAYISGFIAGVLPLAIYLIRKNITSEFISWVFVFNKSIIGLSIAFPLAVALLGGWGAYLLFKKFGRSGDGKAMVIFLVFCLSTLSSLTTTKYAKGGYYLSFWFFVSAVTASGCDIAGLFSKIPSLLKRSLAVGAFFAVLLTSNFHEAFFSGRNTFFRDKEAVRQLKKYTGNDTCVTVVPLHPLFSRDATRFFSYSQYLFCTDSDMVRGDLIGNDIAAKILSLRPAVVVYRYNNRDFMLDLFQKGLISAQDYKKLILFFEENYTRRKIGKESYYIKNDRLEID